MTRKEKYQFVLDYFNLTAPNAETELLYKVRLLALDVGDEADAAGIVLELRVVKSLLGRQSLPPRLRAHLLVVHRHWLAGIHPGMENFPRYQKGWFSLVAPKKRGDGNKPLRGCNGFLCFGHRCAHGRAPCVSRPWPVLSHTQRLFIGAS